MRIEAQLRALGDHLDEVQEPITVGDISAESAAAEVVSSRRGRRWLLMAAVVIVVVGGVASLLALGTNDDDPLPPADSGVVTTSEPTAPTSTDLIDVGAATGRPLTELSKGDVVIPTYLPEGLRLREEASMWDERNYSDFIFALEPGSVGVRVWESIYTERDEFPPLDPRWLEDPITPPIEIAGITWGWDDFEGGYVTRIRSFTVFAKVGGLDAQEVERFIEGLRAVTVDEFLLLIDPGPRGLDGG